MALRPRFTTPLSRARDAALQYVLRPLQFFQPRTQLLIGFGFLTLITTALLVTNYAIGFSEEYREGDVIRANVVARSDVSGVDVAETERRRNAARQATRPIFDFDSTRGASSAGSFRAAWEDLQRQSEVAGQSMTWSGEGGPAVTRAIAARKFSQDDLDRLIRLIRDVADKYIYDDSDAERLNEEIILIDVRNPSGQMVIPSPRTRMLSLKCRASGVGIETFELARLVAGTKGCLDCGDPSINLSQRYS